MKLYGYFRSSAAYRVRIALNLKQIEVEHFSVNLLEGAQKEEAYLTLNPQGRVPYLVDGDAIFGQSMAILEYLEERFPTPPLLPADPVTRAYVRELANIVSNDIHPLNNLAVLQYLKNSLGAGQTTIDDWYSHWIRSGFQAFEARIKKNAHSFSLGSRPTIADVCLVPQLYNARRFKVNLSDFPGLLKIEENCMRLKAFQTAQPENQPDSV